MGRDVRRTRRCKGDGKMAAAMEAVGVRTRSRTLALAAAAERRGGSRRRRRATEVQISCLQLRSAVTPGISRSKPCSVAGRRSSPEMGRISRCSSNASCEVLERKEELQMRSVCVEGGEGLEASGAACYVGDRTERRETAQSSKQRDEHGDLESTAERKITRSASEEAMPSQAEIDDFFTAAETAQKRRFSDKYNYDVDRDAPLDGRFEWVLIKP